MQNYIKNRQNGMTDRDPVFRSLALIEEKIQEKLTVKNLADSVHFSQYHYQRMFRDAVGDSLMGYVTRRRLSLAAAELAETDASVLEIALKYSYDSHEGFTRSFKSWMGITPTEYRKYHLSTSPLIMHKEKRAMIYSKATDEILRELNSLIVQARETAEYTRKSVRADSGAAEFYFDFWKFIGDRTEAMADALSYNLDRITAIARQPDEISARFLIIKAIEDTAFQAGITAFQAGLTTARARPEHREAFMAICGKYESLAQNARIKTDRIAAFLKELATLIFQDMRKNGEQKIQQVVEKGMAAVRDLSGNPLLPYDYITAAVSEITEELSSMALEEITVSCLEDYLFRLDIVAFTADVDTLRAPSHSPLFDGVRIFREQIREATEFFRSLPVEAFCVSAESVCTSAESETKDGAGKRSIVNILLFYLKGEIQKLGDVHLSQEQKDAFDSICSKMNVAIHLTGQETDVKPGKMIDAAAEQAACSGITEILRQVYREMTVQVEGLGIDGTAIQYIAEELKRFFSNLDKVGYEGTVH